MDQRIVFMGTASFSKAVLDMLIDEGYNVVGVVTQPDRYVGRKKVLTMSDVKKVALEHGIKVVQPAKIRTDYEDVLSLEPDLIISAAYGQIVPDAVLEAPRLGCINVHASLLPKYRGGAPVHQAIIDGEKKTGVTIMYMAHKMDAGDIISQIETPITDDDTVSIVYDRLTLLGAKLLKDTLPSVLDGSNPRIPQDESLVTFAPVIKREDERISWNDTMKNVINKVRGMDSWPGTFTIYHGQNIKIWHCAPGTAQGGDVPAGTITELSKTGISVKVSDGTVRITELQVPGKRRMNIKDYMNGKCMFVEGETFE